MRTSNRTYNSAVMVSTATREWFSTLCSHSHSLNHSLTHLRTGYSARQISDAKSLSLLFNVSFYRHRLLTEHRVRASI